MAQKQAQPRLDIKPPTTSPAKQLKKNRPDYVQTDIDRLKSGEMPNTVYNQRRLGELLGSDQFGETPTNLAIQPTQVHDMMRRNSANPLQEPLIRPDINPASAQVSQPLQQKSSLPNNENFAQTEPPKVKIEAPLHDLADLIHNAIKNPQEGTDGPELQRENLSQTQIPQVQTQEANIPHSLDTQVETKEAPISHTLAFENQNNQGQRNYQQEPQLQTSAIQSSGPESTQDRLKNSLYDPPTKDQYEPSKTRRVLAGIAGGVVGFGNGPEEGYKISSGIVDKPYNEAYQDWATRTGALEKESNLELEGRKVDASDRSSLAAYRRAQDAGDPTVQGAISGARKQAEVNVTAPIDEKKAKDLQAGREALANIATDKNNAARKQISDQDRAARAEIAKKSLGSVENRAKLDRELRAKIAENKNNITKNQRVPPTQQAVATMLAENEISKIVDDPEEFKNLFEAIKDAKGGDTQNFKLKALKDIPARWRTKWQATKNEIENFRNKNLKFSFDPSENDSDDENDEDLSDRYEEIEP